MELRIKEGRKRPGKRARRSENSTDLLRPEMIKDSHTSNRKAALTLPGRATAIFGMHGNGEGTNSGLTEEEGYGGRSEWGSFPREAASGNFMTPYIVGVNFGIQQRLGILKCTRHTYSRHRNLAKRTEGAIRELFPNTQATLTLLYMNK